MRCGRAWRSGARGLAIVLLSVGVVATSAAEEEQRAILQLSVNRVNKGNIIVLLRGQDVLVRVANLEDAGLRGFSGAREIAGAEIYVSLASLAPGIRFALDERALALDLSADPALLVSIAVDLGIGPPPGMIFRADTSAFFNYALSLQNFDSVAVFAEGGLSIMGALLFSGASRNDDGTLVRGLSNLTYDDRSHLVRWVLGDRLATSDALGGSLVMGGLSVSREFSIDPYFVSFPRLDVSGVAATPSTVDLYVNGRLQRQEILAPGTFELRNVPVPAGGGVARLVVRDAFGREREITSPFYLTTTLLSRGLNDYSYNLGFRRNNLATQSWNYDRPEFLGRHRYGLTDTITAGARLEASSDLVSGGPTITAGFPLGEVEVAAAGSGGAAGAGVAGTIGYRYIGRPLNFGAVARASSDRYANLSLSAKTDRPLVEVGGFVGAQLGTRTDVTLQYAWADFRDRGPEGRGSAFCNVRLTDRASLLLSVSRSTQTSAKPTTEAFAGLTVYLGARTTGTVSYQRQGNQNVGELDVQRALPVGPGFGYRVQVDTTGEAANGGVMLQYQGPYGRYEASYLHANGKDTTLLSTAGGIAALDGTVFATRPLTDSFAVIRVPGVAGVRGYLNNQEVGRTDSRGDLPVPDLLAYYGNRLGIADQDIPLDHSVGVTERTIATPLRGGALVAFPVQRVQAVTGTVILAIAGAPVVPAYGQLFVTADGRRFESPIGGNGEYYLENLPVGRHPAVVEYEGKRCSLALDVPAASGPVMTLDPLRCAVP